MLKKLLSIALAATALLSVSAPSFYAANVDSSDSGADVSEVQAGAEVSEAQGADVSDSSTGADNLIYFDAGKWANVKNIYCYIWIRGTTTSFFGWETRRSECKNVSGSLYSYDLSKLNESTDIEGGLKADEDYCVIFSANTGVQTYDQTFGPACVGDTAKLTGEMIENPMDSEKSAFESVWTTNSSKYGPHLAITSLGNIVGSKLCPHENHIELLGDWLSGHVLSVDADVHKTLVNALKKFNLRDIVSVMSYIKAKGVTDDLDLMEEALEKAFKEAFPSEEPATIPEEIPEYTEPATDAEGNIINVDDPDSPGGSGSGGAGSSGSGANASGGSYGNSSGSGADGQETLIFYVLGGIIVISVGVMLISRKRRD